MKALLSSEPKSSSCSLLKMTMRRLTALAMPSDDGSTDISTVPQVEKRKHTQREILLRLLSHSAVDVCSLCVYVCLCAHTGPRSEHPQGSVSRYTSGGEHCAVRGRGHAGRYSGLHLACVGREYLLGHIINHFTSFVPPLTCKIKTTNSPILWENKGLGNPAQKR